MFFDFHTHLPQRNALVSSVEKAEDVDFWSLEFHPWHLPEIFVSLNDDFLLKAASASALGEIGLDRLKGPDLAVQRQYLSELLDIAQRFGKPVVIHSVRCDSEMDSAFKNFSGNVLIHGFRGGEKRLLEHLERGRFVSFSPGAWRNCTDLLLKRGLDHIGLETDDTSMQISDIYHLAEKESKIPGWEEKCEKNFLRFIGEC